MKERIKLDDILWAYTNDGRFSSAFIINTDGDRCRDLLTRKIYELEKSVKHSNITSISDMLLKCISKNLGFSEKDISVIDSSNMILSQSGTDLALFITCPAFRKYVFSGESAIEYCTHQKVDMKEVATLAKHLSNSIKHDYNKELRLQKDEEEYTDMFVF